MQRAGKELIIDVKHKVIVDNDGNPVIVKRSSYEEIPENEPAILFRGRDRLALPMLRFYRKLCVDDGATKYQLDSVDMMIAQFDDWAKTHPVKQPGISQGLKWDGTPS